MKDYKTWDEVVEDYLKGNITTDELIDLMDWFNLR